MRKKIHFQWKKTVSHICFLVARATQNGLLLQLWLILEIWHIFSTSPKINYLSCNIFFSIILPCIIVFSSKYTNIRCTNCCWIYLQLSQVCISDEYSMRWKEGKQGSYHLNQFPLFCSKLFQSTLSFFVWKCYQSAKNGL